MSIYVFFCKVNFMKLKDEYITRYIENMQNIDDYALEKLLKW